MNEVHDTAINNCIGMRTLLEKLFDFQKTSLVPRVGNKLDKDVKSMWKQIKDLYDSSDASSNICAVILNAVLTSNMPLFLMSKNILNELIKNDKNIKRETVNSREYRQTMSKIVKGNLLECVKSGTSFGKGQRRASFYKLKDETLRGMIENLQERENILNEEFNKLERLNNEKKKLL